MNVSAILRRKGTHVETAVVQTTAVEAAERMRSKAVGSLVIVDLRGNLIGVLSERDLVRAMAECPSSIGEVRVGELLCTRPVICKADDSLQHVMGLMSRKRTRHLPVLAGDALIGLVSIGDVVKGQLEDLELEVGVLRDYARVHR
jgi:CBS domain-containing protein